MPADKRAEAKRRREWRDPRPAKSAKYPAVVRGKTHRDKFTQKR